MATWWSSVHLRASNPMRLLDRNFRYRVPQYIFQCGLATASLFVILLVQDAVLRAAIVVAIASTAFIIFVVPHSEAASPRKVVGGHLTAVIVGSVLSGILGAFGVDTFAGDSRYAFYVAAAISVGLSTFLMVITDTEHAPAAGTALGLVIPGWSGSAVVFIISGAVILSLVRILLRPKLINLL